MRIPCFLSFFLPFCLCLCWGFVLGGVCAGSCVGSTYPLFECGWRREGGRATRAVEVGAGEQRDVTGRASADRVSRIGRQRRA